MHECLRARSHATSLQVVCNPLAAHLLHCCRRAAIDAPDAGGAARR
jgi:hypothetical protein